MAFFGELLIPINIQANTLFKILDYEIRKLSELRVCVGSLEISGILKSGAILSSAFWQNWEYRLTIIYSFLSPAPKR
jgi:hypothetical protein